jgi:LCP family protein required for cell wall assembly
MHEFQPIRVVPTPLSIDIRSRRSTRPPLLLFLVIPLVAAYFFTPGRANILILGTDDSAQRGSLGRTDSIMLATIDPWAGYTGLLGIPRDLWVNVPGVGAQRINTAYFFAEAQQPGSGAEAAMETVRQNFGVTVNYSLVLRMDGVVRLVDALGGVTITLDAPMGGLPAGTHTLDGIQTLAFVRERYSADDFSRIKQGQIIMQAVYFKMLNPLNWPQAAMSLGQSVSTDIPSVLYPRLGFAMLRASIFGFDTRSITREMVTPFQTSGGAQVLAPNWDAINPVLLEMFGE